jgi:uncharacterized protein (TIGR02284 family)
MTDGTNQNDISTLNDLTALCIDSARGYREAAEQSRNASFAEMCRSRATERDSIVHEFQAEVGLMNGTPEEHGTTAGSLHRLMLDVRAMIGNDLKAAINEVERGEDVIKGAFEKAMKREDLSPRIMAMITRCFTSIRLGHDQMSAMKSAVG